MNSGGVPNWVYYGGVLFIIIYPPITSDDMWWLWAFLGGGFMGACGYCETPSRAAIIQSAREEGGFSKLFFYLFIVYGVASLVLAGLLTLFLKLT